MKYNCCVNSIFYFIEFVEILDTKLLKNVISRDDQLLAENLKLPLSFFLYKTKPTCKGCVGCENESDVSIKLMWLYLIYLIN